MCNENWKCPVQIPVVACRGLGTQPCYEVPGDIRVEFVENVVINIALVRRSQQE